jgi:hypothetical protein
MPRVNWREGYLAAHAIDPIPSVKQTVAGGEHQWKVVELGNTEPLILAEKDGISSV